MTSLSANLVSFDYILILCILATLFNQPRLCYTQNQFWVNWVISDWVIVLCLITQSCLTLTLWTVAPPGFSVHGDSPGKNPEVGCHALLEETFPKAGIKPKSLASQADSLPSEPLGKSMNTEVSSLSLFRGKSRPRNRTGVSCIADGFFNHLSYKSHYRWVISSLQ